ncbi:MAG: hypothetical protein ABMA02_11925 [Saprospiraceae bacterium]
MNWTNPKLDTVYSEQPILIGALSQDTISRRAYYTVYQNEASTTLQAYLMVFT